MFKGFHDIFIQLWIIDCKHFTSQYNEILHSLEYKYHFEMTFLLTPVSSRNRILKRSQLKSSQVALCHLKFSDTMKNLLIFNSSSISFDAAECPTVCAQHFRIVTLQFSRKSWIYYKPRLSGHSLWARGRTHRIWPPKFSFCVFRDLRGGAWIIHKSQPPRNHWLLKGQPA